MSVVFVGGASRSGSTLLDRMLGSEEGWASLGEVHHIWHRGMLQNHFCGCGERFRDCPTWREILRRLGALSDTEAFARSAITLQREAIRTRRIPAMSRKIKQSLPQPGPEAEYAALLTSLYAAAREVLQASTLVDSSKRAAHGFVLAGAPDLEVPLIHMIRDSRATAYALAKNVTKSDGGASELMQTQTPPKSARTWAQANAMTELLAHRVPRSTRLRYEDLAIDPAAAVHETLDALGLRASLNWLDGNMADFKDAHTVSGNPMRLHRGPMAISLDDRWRTKLPAKDRRIVTALSAPWLLKYGYSLR